MTPWWAYLSRHMAARGWTAAELSRASGIDQSVIGRWRDRGARPTPENVRRAARGLGRELHEAIIAAGHYTADELAVDATGRDAVDLTAVSHEKLAREVYARMRAGSVPRRQRPARPREVAPAAGHDVAETVVDRHDAREDVLPDLAENSLRLSRQHADG